MVEVAGSRDVHMHDMMAHAGTRIHDNTVLCTLEER